MSTFLTRLMITHDELARDDHRMNRDEEKQSSRAVESLQLFALLIMNLKMNRGTMNPLCSPLHIVPWLTMHVIPHIQDCGTWHTHGFSLCIVQRELNQNTENRGA